MNENYIYKKEVDWSLLVDGLTIPIENQVVFTRNMGTFLGRGEKKEIRIVLQGKSYKARIVNVNFDRSKYRRKDVYQIRYSSGSELAVALQSLFVKSYHYFLNQRTLREKRSRSMIKLPDESKEYLVLYTTDYEDTYVADAITTEDLELVYEILPVQDECIFENSINYNICDETSKILLDERIVKIRKLNKAIGENLKLLYGYRCQICGNFIGDKYDANVVEAHHIDYYVKSMNNDSNNQLIICPNHHRIIHQVDPIFDRKSKLYIYSNGLIEELALNYHI
jgi:hypothetical protein